MSGVRPLPFQPTLQHGRGRELVSVSQILPQSESPGASLGLNPKSEFVGSEEHTQIVILQNLSPTSLDAQARS